MTHARHQRISLDTTPYSTLAPTQVDAANQLFVDAASLMLQADGEQQQADSYATLVNANQPIHTYAYDEGRKLLGVYDVAGERQDEFVYLGGTPIAEVDGSQVYFIHTDHLATPRAMTDGGKRVVWRWVRRPFGDSAPDEDADGDGVKVGLNLRFPGQYFDGETGLSYNYFRDYDPKSGRYIESDPIGLRGGLNTYAYVLSDPLSWTDPTGLYGYDGFAGAITGMPPSQFPPNAGSCGLHRESTVVSNT